MKMEVTPRKTQKDEEIRPPVPPPADPRGARPKAGWAASKAALSCFQKSKSMPPALGERKTAKSPGGEKTGGGKKEKTSGRKLRVPWILFKETSRSLGKKKTKMSGSEIDSL